MYALRNENHTHSNYVINITVLIDIYLAVSCCWFVNISAAG